MQKTPLRIFRNGVFLFLTGLRFYFFSGRQIIRRYWSALMYLLPAFCMSLALRDSMYSFSLNMSSGLSERLYAAERSESHVLFFSMFSAH